MTVTDVNVVKVQFLNAPMMQTKELWAHCSAFAEATEWQGGGYVGKGCVKNGHRSCKMCLAEKYLPDCCPNDS